jgi:hypothetical protein
MSPSPQYGLQLVRYDPVDSTWMVYDIFFPGFTNPVESLCHYLTRRENWLRPECGKQGRQSDGAPKSRAGWGLAPSGPSGSIRCPERLDTQSPLWELVDLAGDDVGSKVRKQSEVVFAGSVTSRPPWGRSGMVVRFSSGRVYSI